MIGLDTNVLIRYLAQDDPLQSPIAVNFIETVCSEKHPGFINHIVLCETVWVLDRCYDIEKDTIVVILEKILKTEQFTIQSVDRVWRALREFKKTAADFADCLLSQDNIGNRCEHTVTFDKKASISAGYRLLNA
jgi:predicted nucleic-acid-binding protein